MSEKPVLILGNGGHAKVLIETLLLMKRNIIGYTSPSYEKNAFSLPYLGDDNAIFNYEPREIDLINAIGSSDNTSYRKSIFESFREKGYHFSNVIHPSSVISKSARLGEGIQIMAGAVVQSFVEIADNTIVNTATSVDHDCRIGKHCHLAPGCKLSGMVTVEDNTHIGTGTTVIQSINIGSNVLIGAGSLVLKNINKNAKVYGVPAKEV